MGNRRRSHICFFLLVGFATEPSLRAQTRPPPPASGPPASVTGETDELFRWGQLLFERLAPADIRAQYDFPSKERWDTLVAKFHQALTGDSLTDLANCAEEGRHALSALRIAPGFQDLADWLEQRIDEMEAAQQLTRPTPATPPAPKPIPKTPPRPGTPSVPTGQPVPHYTLWLNRVRDRPLPERATQLLPRLHAAFVAEGVPTELAWVAEAESSFNPSARSPAGAKGLFQFMPDTAKSLGLGTFMPDERADPEKSARAAARYLKSLHQRFGNWALALAAYNAGPTRVARTLAAHRATSYTAIADALPAETRMYVPKVYALIATRTGVTPYRLQPPR